MKKVFLFLTILLTLTTAKAQAPVELSNETVKEIVTKEKEYYNDIVKVFLSDDPYLRIDDIALVYYGHAFSPDFLTTNDLEEKLKEYSANSDYRNMYNTAKEILKKNPVSLNALFYAWTASGKLGKSKEEQTSYVTKYLNIINMICTYGNGKAPETAFRVINPDDQDHILYGELQVQTVLSRELDRQALCNIIKIQPTGKHPYRTVYFDISLYLTNGSN